MGLVVLTHESMHMSGIQDEGLAECAAQRHVAWVAVQLGLSQRSAQSVAHWEATDWADGLPEQYRTCSRGSPGA